MTRRLLAPLVAFAVAIGCAPTGSPGPSGTAAGSPGTTSAASEAAGGPYADLLLLDGNVVTMDEARPHAEALAITGDRIVAVGSIAEVQALGGPDTRVVRLDGRTVTPGFADAHQHRIGNGPSALGVPARQLIDEAIAQGLTSIHELYVDDARLAELRALDDAGDLRLRVNAYLAANENSAEGTPFDPYYDAYGPGQAFSPHVRIAGLKVFTDFDNAQILLFEQADLDAFVLDLHRKGWPLGIKTVSSRSLAMIVEAVDAAGATEPSIVDARVRLEHMLFATPAQIERLHELGMVPAINLNLPGQVVGDASIDALIAGEPDGSYVPWRSLFEAGLPATGISGFPSYHVDEPTGAPFGSPLHLMYQAVTGVGNLGTPSPAELLAERIDPEQAMRALTINAAFAAFQEGDLGSLTPGKLADIVVLSADPLAVPPAEINEITVTMTLIGGDVVFCAEGEQARCAGAVGQGPAFGPIATTGPVVSAGPSVNLASFATATASSAYPAYPASNAIDGGPAHWNALDVAPGWIELTLPGPSRIESIRLMVAQDPAGQSEHEVWVRMDGGGFARIHVFAGVTREGDVLAFTPSAPLDGVVAVRIETTELAGGLAPAWREIELLGSP